MNIIKIILEAIVITLLGFAIFVLFESLLNHYFFDSYNSIWYLSLTVLGLFISRLNMAISKTIRNKIWVGLFFLLGIITMILIFTYDY